MVKSQEPVSRPEAKESGQKSDIDPQYQRRLFIGAASSMSIQLAIVVLIPIVGGFKIDEHLKTSPLWTIVGFLLAILGTFAVLYRVFHEFNGKPVVKK
jgi:F0F1-type ATP synthase assembly protein I